MKQSPSEEHDESGDPTTDCRLAIDLGAGLLMTIVDNPLEYKLVSADNVLHVDAHIWRLTFKPKSLLPVEDQLELGAGGELFIDANVATRQANLSGYGE
jgi:hypothetical protein